MNSIPGGEIIPKSRVIMGFSWVITVACSGELNHVKLLNFT